MKNNTQKTQKTNNEGAAGCLLVIIGIAVLIVLAITNTPL